MCLDTLIKLIQKIPYYFTIATNGSSSFCSMETLTLTILLVPDDAHLFSLIGSSRANDRPVPGFARLFAVKDTYCGTTFRGPVQGTTSTAVTFSSRWPVELLPARDPSPLPCPLPSSLHHLFFCQPNILHTGWEVFNEPPQ